MSAATMNEMERLRAERDALAVRLEQAHAAKTHAEEAELAAAQELDEVKAARDALAAHVDRLREVLRIPTNQYDLWTQDGGFDRWIAIALETLDDESPTISLAHLKAEWQAEALEKLADRIGWEHLAEPLREEAGRIRRQAEESRDD